MIRMKSLCVMALVLGVALATPASAQVQTEAPAVVPGAQPVTVERIKVHGTSLEGTLKQQY